MNQESALKKDTQEFPSLETFGQLTFLPLLIAADNCQTSSVGDSLVKTSAQQEPKKAYQGKDRDCSLKSFDFVARLDLNTSCWKTAPTSLESTKDENSELFLGRWPRSGMMQNGFVFQRPVSVPYTKEIESGLSRTQQKTELKFFFAIPASGLIPTVTAADATVGSVFGKEDSLRVTSTGSIRKVNRNGFDSSIGLGRLVRMPLPTPLARDWKGATSKNRNSKTLPDLFQFISEGLYLNPDFVESMMGFPVGWTDLSKDKLPEPLLLKKENLEIAMQNAATPKPERHKHRIMQLGNSIVPQVAKLAFDRIKQLEA